MTLCRAHCADEDCFCTAVASCMQVAPRICCAFCVSCPCTAAQLFCSCRPIPTQSEPPPPGPKGNWASAAPAHCHVRSRRGSSPCHALAGCRSAEQSAAIAATRTWGSALQVAWFAAAVVAKAEATSAAPALCNFQEQIDSTLKGILQPLQHGTWSGLLSLLPLLRTPTCAVPTHCNVRFGQAALHITHSAAVPLARQPAGSRCRRKSASCRVCSLHASAEQAPCWK